MKSYMKELTMTQEDKEILLRDLCSRLPYRVKVQKLNETESVFEVYAINTESTQITFFKYKGKSLEICDGGFLISPNNFLRFKPYLRPMSSMTNEEIDELKELCSIYIPTDSKNIGFEDYGILVFTHHLTDNSYSFKLNLNVIDWLNKNMFDYRGLIEKGLALEATKDMYKI